MRRLGGVVRVRVELIVGYELMGDLMWTELLEAY